MMTFLAKQNWRKNSFEKIGLRRGDRCAIITPHSPYGIITCLSLAWNGITSVLIDASLPQEEINRILELSDVRALFTVNKVLQGIPQRLTNHIPVFELGRDGSIYFKDMNTPTL